MRFWEMLSYLIVEKSLLFQFNIDFVIYRGI